jgi:hypothetical protein
MRGATTSWGAVARSEVEDDPGGPSWAERPDTQADKEKFRKKINGSPGNFGPDWFRAALRKRKRFLDFWFKEWYSNLIFFNISKPNLN